MVRYIVANAALGGAVLLVGALISDLSYGHEDLAEILAKSGLAYGTLSLCMLVVPLYKMCRPYIDAASVDRRERNAYEGLIKLKRLLDERIISQDEFDVKSKELKAKLL